MTPVGFPHSEIRASVPACGSTRLIAACHVLHRLPAPRHPPYALIILMASLKNFALCSFQRSDAHSRGRIAGSKPDGLLQNPKALKTEQQLLEGVKKKP